MLFLEKRKRGPVRLNIALFTFNLQAFVSHKTFKSEVWSLIKFIYFLYPPWGKANNKTAKHWAHPLTFGSTDFISTAETGVRLLQPQFYHGRLCISFWLEVKGSGGAEKWRGLLKARAAFLRCSGEHPSSYFTQVGAHRSQSWCTSSAVKKSQRQAAKTAGWEWQNIALKEWEENTSSVHLWERLYACCREPERLAAAVGSTIVRSLADLTVEAITVMLLQV